MFSSPTKLAIYLVTQVMVIGTEITLKFSMKNSKQELGVITEHIS